MKKRLSSAIYRLRCNRKLNKALKNSKALRRVGRAVKKGAGIKDGWL